MSGTGTWIIGALLGVFALTGLFAASRAVDAVFYYGGFGVFVVCIGAIFILIDRAYSRLETRLHQDPERTDRA